MRDALSRRSGDGAPEPLPPPPGPPPPPDLPIPPQPSEAENLELLEEIASLSKPSGRSDVQELIDTAEIPVIGATRPSAGVSGRTHRP